MYAIRSYYEMRLQKIKTPVDHLIAGFSILVMIALVVCVVWQVFSRYVLNAPSTMTDEIARFSMIWVGLLGAAYGVGQQRHLSIDLFTMNLKGKKKLINQIFVNICILAFAGGVITSYSIHYTKLYDFPDSAFV